MPIRHIAALATVVGIEERMTVHLLATNENYNLTNKPDGELSGSPFLPYYCLIMTQIPLYNQLLQEMSNLIAELGREYLELPNPEFNYNAEHVSPLLERLDEVLVELRDSNDTILVSRARTIMSLWAKSVRREFDACREARRIGFRNDRRRVDTAMQRNSLAGV